MAGKSKLKAGENVWENSDTMERVKSVTRPVGDGWNPVVPVSHLYELYQGKSEWKQAANLVIFDGPV